MASPGMYPPPYTRRRSVVGPILLIVIGTLFLLHNFGYAFPRIEYFVKFWPLVLVAIGLVRMAEYFASRNAGRPVPAMSGGTVFLLVVLVLIGLAMSAAIRHRNLDWEALRNNPDMDDNLLHLFGSEHTYDGELTQAMPPGGLLRVNSERGNITVNNWDQPQVKVVYHKRIFAGSQDEADSTDKATMPQFQVQGTTVEVQANTEGAGSKGVASDMEVYAPEKADVELTAQRGDVAITQRTGNVKVNAQHGDVSVDQVKGNVNVTTRHGSLNASNITGDLTSEGRLDDLTLDSIAGTVTVTADIFGDTQLSKLEKGATIRTSRTEMQFARLDGDLTMDTGDLQGDGVQGPFSLSTRAKDVDLRNLKGDAHISNDVGDISLEDTSVAALGNLNLATHHGDVHLRLPARANFQFSLATRHGDISSDFENTKTEHAGASTATGTVGRGSVKINVASDTGDIEIRKVENAGTTPPASPAPPAKPEKPSRGVGDDDVL